ncbi:MAG: PstS family phosphate ABC transporter substrate-binding protein [Pirellulaceae bacterium]|nr:PstS family phosphate ABC transporter substrate-binding protein [Pirellulaceae bacterium]
MQIMFLVLMKERKEEMKQNQGALSKLGSLAILMGVLFSGCGTNEVGGDGLSGAVKVDGSSTVFPITEAIAEEFGKSEPRVRVTVGVSGTGGGFKKFCIGEVDINDASRTIKPSEEEKATENNISYVELPVAFDGISVIVNPKNDFVDYLTTDELKKIWEPGSTVQKWSDIRSDWPATAIKLYAPGVDSGTFDYFTDEINGESQACRSDFTASEDDNVLVQGISGDVNALGFFGYAYYAENKSKLKIVPIDNGSGPVAPTQKTINNGAYAPLSRPVFIYVSTESAKRPEVNAFIEFYLDNVGSIANEVGYVGLPEEVYTLAKKRFQGKVTGSAFNDPKNAGLDITELLK